MDLLPQGLWKVGRTMAVDKPTMSRERNLLDAIKGASPQGPHARAGLDKPVSQASPGYI